MPDTTAPVFAFVIAAFCGFAVAFPTSAAADREKRCFGAELADLELESVEVDGEANEDLGAYRRNELDYRITGYGYGEELLLNVRHAVDDTSVYTLWAVRQ